MLPLVGLTTGAGSPARLATGVVATLARPARAVGSVAGSVAGAVAVAVGTRGEDGAWSRPGRVHVPVDDAHAGAATEAMWALDGVRWAGFDRAAGRLVVDHDEAVVGAAAVLDAVRAAGAHDTRDDRVREHPADPRPLATAVTGLAVSTAGTVAASLGRLAHLPALPTSATSVIALADAQPVLRRALEERFGRAATDTAVAAANAVVQGLAQGTLSLAVDVALRTAEVLELQARRVVWAGREPELYPGPPPDPALALTGDERRPMPAGPVERYTERVGAGGLVAAGATLALTRSLDRAGQALLVAAPRGARAAREACACSLTVGLARHGIVPLTREGYRRLDRVDLVLVDSRALRGPRRLVLAAEPAVADPGPGDWTREEIWSAAQRLLWQDGPLPVPPPKGRSLERLALAHGDGTPLPAGPGAPTALGPGSEDCDLLEDGRIVGRVLVGRELDPLATPVVAAARTAGLRLVLTDDAGLGALAGAADELLPAGTSLTEAVRRLQGRGRVVAVVSPGADLDAARALQAADLGVAVLGRAGDRVPVPAADLVAGPSLDAVRRVLLAAPAVRRASATGVTLATGGAALGGLLLVASPPGTSGSRTVLPVHLASGLALLTGHLLGRSAAGAPAAEPVAQVPWHALEPDEVVVRLRLAQLARAAPPAPATHPPGPVTALAGMVRRFGGQVAAELADPLTPVLSVGAAASAILGSGTDAALVGSVMAGNAVISGGQRLRADTALRELLLQEELPARLVAEGREPARVPAAALLPGDVVELRPGDVVPADARLLTVDGLEVDEASLTGESAGVHKHVAATPGADVAERTCMVHEGTVVLAGTGRAVVVAVGAATEAGRAVTLARQAPSAGGLQARLQVLTRRVLPMTLAGGGLVTGLALLRGQAVREALASGVAVSVAAVPEGLPLVTTVAQLAAARRLSRRGVLVRSSRTVEALGRVDTVCFDKTGTLTQGRLRLVRVADLSGTWAPSDPAARRLLRAAALSSPRSAEPVLHATDRAVLDAAGEHLPAPADEAWDDLAEVPFDSGRGYSAALGRFDRRTHLVAKGAPEVVLARCGAVATGGDDDAGLPVAVRLDDATLAHARRLVHQLAGDGLRVLAVAYRPLLATPAAPGDPQALEGEVDDLTLLGFVALADTPRAEAEDAVRRLRAAGVSVRMITGDHPVTARAIAEQVGLARATVVTGRDLEGLDEEARVRAVASASVFARVSPEQKVRIVEALRRAGRVVAMTGDGTNDAAAIRLADVGLGMGTGGSTAARRAGDLVLTRPDLGLVLEALGEGRAMWARARDAVGILVGGNLGEVAFTVAGTALAGRAPLGTRQFLLVNLLTDLFPAMAVAVAPTRELGDALPPLGASGELGRGIAVRGSVTAAAATAAWLAGRATGLPRRASTMGLTALVGAQLGQTLVVAHRDPGVVLTAVGSAAALATVVTVPGLSQMFGCTPLDPFAWATVMGCATGATALGMLAPRVLPHVTPRVAALFGPQLPRVSHERPLVGAGTGGTA